VLSTLVVQVQGLIQHAEHALSAMIGYQHVCTLHVLAFHAMPCQSSLHAQLDQLDCCALFAGVYCPGCQYMAAECTDIDGLEGLQNPSLPPPLQLHTIAALNNAGALAPSTHVPVTQAQTMFPIRMSRLWCHMPSMLQTATGCKFKQHCSNQHSSHSTNMT